MLVVEARVQHQDDDPPVVGENTGKLPDCPCGVQVPGHQASDIQVWEDTVIAAVIAAHPDELRAIPELAASCGMREGELFGLAAEDFGLDERIVRVRRQVKRVGCASVFALPKNDRERIIPLSGWDVEVIRRHISRYPPRPYSLPWEKPDGKPHTCSLLFRWASDGQHVKARSYSETVWKPAIVQAGIIPEPKKDNRGRARYATTRREGIHQLRHYYASVMLAGGVSIKELAEYLGHADPAFTLRVYAHLLPSSHDPRPHCHQRSVRLLDERSGEQGTRSPNRDGTGLIMKHAAPAARPADGFPSAPAD